MAAPTIKVELGFGATWQTEPGSITWTDVTSFVLQPDRLVAQRGAGSARGRVDVGTCGFALKNADRRFDPTYTSGAYYPNVKSGVPVRVTGTPSGGSSKSVWYGSVAKWPQRYDLGNAFGWVPVECFDGFDKLSRAKIPRSVLEVEMLADSPKALFMLDDSGTSMIDASGNQHTGSYTSSVSALRETVTMPGGGRVRGIRFDGTVRGSSTVTLPGTGTGADERLTVSCVVEPDVATATTEGAYAWEIGSGPSNRELTSGAFGAAGAVFRDRSRSSGDHIEGVVTITDSLTSPFHAGLRRDTLNALYGYIDGSGTVANGSIDPAPASVGDGTVIGGHKSRFFVGFLAAVGLYEPDISAARITDHYNAANAPLDGQTSDERITWILDQIDWPANLRNLETGDSTLGVALFEPGDNVLEYFRLIEATEDGLLFCGPDGKLRFLNRYWRYQDTLATSVQFTFTDADTTKGYAEFDLDLDDELLVNIARYTRRGGTEQVSVNTTSVNTYGEADHELSNLLNPSDLQTKELANWTVATRSTPLPRVPKIRVPLHRYSAADQATVLGLDLGHRVRCVRTPQGVGSAITLDFLVDGITQTVGEGEWWWEAFVSPVPADTVNVFVLNTSELSGTHVLGY